MKECDRIRGISFSISGNVDLSAGLNSFMEAYICVPVSSVFIEYWILIRESTMGEDENLEYLISTSFSAHAAARAGFTKDY